MTSYRDEDFRGFALPLQANNETIPQIPLHATSNSLFTYNSTIQC